MRLDVVGADKACDRDGSRDLAFRPLGRIFEFVGHPPAIDIDRKATLGAQQREHVPALADRARRIKMTLFWRDQTCR